MLRALLDIALDLTSSLDSRARYQRLIAAVHRVVPCDAVALLRNEGGALVAVATEGLSPEVLGRRFVLADHPRLAALVGARRPVRFAADDPLPDPYDGFVESSPDRCVHVHSCMGSPLFVGDQLVGVLTVDALEPGRFDHVEDAHLATFAALAAAALRTAGLIEALERAADKKGRVARDLVTSALMREGGELVGPSAVMESLRAEIALVADSSLSVLVVGETGTGKELVARTLHRASRRADEPLVHVNCAALPESVAESELFGHVRGAFTGAIEDRVGKFDLADGGTLFLDEIGELPLSLQPKLLRVLQTGELQRVGSDRQLRVDVRVIAATNRDLPAEVAAGRFRADLYHRLAVYPLRVPSLRQRGDDVVVLAGCFADRAQVQLGAAAVRLSPAAREALRAYDWPGNVRELEHVILRAALRASPGRGRQVITLEPHHLGLEVSSAASSPAEPAGTTGATMIDDPEARDEQATPSLAAATEAFQRRLVQRSVDAAGGNWSEAARRLGVDRANLHRVARRLGIKD